MPPGSVQETLIGIRMVNGYSYCPAFRVKPVVVCSRIASDGNTVSTRYNTFPEVNIPGSLKLWADGRIPYESPLLAAVCRASRNLRAAVLDGKRLSPPS